MVKEGGKGESSDSLPFPDSRLLVWHLPKLSLDTGEGETSEQLDWDYHGVEGGLGRQEQLAQLLRGVHEEGGLLDQ